jgi:N6-L-threonylcarbamoyladenine synthase
LLDQAVQIGLPPVGWLRKGLIPAAATGLKQALIHLEQRCALDGLAWRVAPLAYCTDNAAMIGVAAAQRLASGQSSCFDLGVAARLPLEQAGMLYESQPCF